MSQKRSYKHDPKEFKEEAVVLVLEQGYTVLEAAKSLGITADMLYKWKELHEQQTVALWLIALAGRYQKHPRGKKKANPLRRSHPKQPHVATARLLKR